MRIRDIPEIIKIWNNNLTEGTVKLLMIYDLYKNKYKFQYVCFYIDQIIGFIICKKQKNNFLYISTLCVDKEFQNIGIGSYLLNFIIHKYKKILKDKKNSFLQIKLNVRSDNINAINFYKKFNFVVDENHEICKDNFKILLMVYKKSL